MCKFYSWSDEYVESLDVYTFSGYWKSINVIEARSRLIDLNILMMPHVDEKVRKKFYKDLEKEAYPIPKSSKKLSNKDLMDILSRR